MPRLSYREMCDCKPLGPEPKDGARFVDTKTGQVWLRRRCGSCRARVIWIALGDKVPMCEKCEHVRDVPRGVRRGTCAIDIIRAQERQYHGRRFGGADS